MTQQRCRLLRDGGGRQHARAHLHHGIKKARVAEVEQAGAGSTSLLPLPELNDRHRHSGWAELHGRRRRRSTCRPCRPRIARSGTASTALGAVDGIAVLLRLWRADGCVLRRRSRLLVLLQRPSVLRLHLPLLLLEALELLLASVPKPGVVTRPRPAVPHGKKLHKHQESRSIEQACAQPQRKGGSDSACEKK